MRISDLVSSGFSSDLRSLPRSRPLQGGQRQPGPQGRRRPVAGGRPAPPEHHRAGRQPGAHRRRRIRRHRPSVAIAPDRGCREAMVEALYESYLIDGHLVHVGSSVGIAVGSAETACASDLLRRADVAMYEAKGSKPASFKIFDDRQTEMIAVRASMREERSEE